jgi:DNA-directed RNA polymerase beta subunit
VNEQPRSLISGSPVSPVSVDLQQPRSIISGQAITPPEFRDFGDNRTTRNYIYDDVLETVNNLDPVVGKRYQLSLSNAKYVDPPKFSRRKQKEALLRGDTLGRRLKGTWQMTDLQSGKVVDQREQIVARVPFFTHRGTFIHRGNEYTVNNQQRLLPGVFTRRMNNGQLESHLNILPGKGVSHRYFLNPETGVFALKVGQAEMPLLPLFRAMGATDKQLREAWGDDLFAANYKRDDPSVVKKLAARILRKSEASDDEGTTRARLKAAFENMELDDTVTQRTLGKGYKNLSLDAMVDTTKKLLAVSRGEQDVDDRDQLGYQRFLGAEDFLVERLKKDHSKIRRNLLFKAALTGNLSKIPSGALTPQLEQVLTGSGLGSAIEEINPLEIFDKQSRVTRLGEGGIPSTESIPDEARNVQSSHFGFIDPLRTPECYDEHTQVLTADGWRYWSEAVTYPELEYACLVDGRMTFARAEKVYAAPYKGIMLQTLNCAVDFKVTPNHRMYVSKYRAPKEKWEFISAEDMYQSQEGWYLRNGGHLGTIGNNNIYAVVYPHHEVPEVYQSSSYVFRKQFIEMLFDNKLGIASASKTPLQWYTDSEKVADGVSRLLSSLGVSHDVRTVKAADAAKTLWAVCLLSNDEIAVEVSSGIPALYPHLYQGIRKVDYAGTVYCATVPGGLLYVRRNNCPGFWCGNSQAAGIDLNVARNARKGRDGRLYAKFRDTKTKEEVWRSPQDVADSVIAFPGYEKSKASRVPAMKGGKVTFVKKKDIDLVLPHFEDAFSPLGNMVPMKSLVKGQRVAMASRMLTQALSLQNGQTPLVQGAIPGRPEESFEEEYGKHLGSVRAAKDGKVVGVDGDMIKVQFDDGSTDDIEMYNYFPFNRKSFIHQTSLVKPGQAFKKGQPLTRSNFTDDKGSAAMGLNARVAYMPWKGYNYEDAIVISEAMAKRMTSEHAYQHEVEVDDRTRTGKKNYISLFPQKFDKKTLEKLDDEGLVRPGTIVNYGEPLILAAQQKDVSAGKIHKRKQAGFNDSAVLWNHHDPGVVTDAVNGRKGPVVMVRSLNQMQVGDKMCFDDKTYILTGTRGWVRVSDLRHADTICTLREGKEIAWHRPTHIWAYKHNGDMFHYVNDEVDMLVTLNHRLWVRHGTGEFFALEASKFNDWVQPGSEFLSMSATGEHLVTSVTDGRKGELVHYYGNVFCITVENHVILTRRNDKVHWSHNSGRYGDKGVIAAIVPDGQMPTDKGGKPFEVLLNPLGVITRCYDADTEFLTFRGWRKGNDVADDDILLIFDPITGRTRWGRQQSRMYAADYDGRMLACAASHVDFMVTPNHKMWARCDYPEAEWQETTAERIAFHRWYVPTVGSDAVPGVETPWVLGELPFFSSKARNNLDAVSISARDAAAFLGWYLAEGHTVYREPTESRKGEYKVFIAQDENANPTKCEEIADLLSRLPFGWFYKHSTQQFVINSKQLAAECLRLGKVHNKRVPQWLFDQPPDIRQVFLDAIWQGDGYVGTSNTGEFKTLGSVSEGLIDDLQLLWQLQGFAAIKRPVKVKPQHRPMWRCAVMLRKTDRMLQAKDWRELHYCGKIYCPTVETGYVVTRRNGKPLIAGNTNPAQMVEAALGKLAEKKGAPVKVPDFSDVEDMTEWAYNLLKDNNLSSDEDVNLPELGMKIGGVATGNRFFMKLHHTAEGKLQARSGGSYSAEETPSKGGETGCFIYNTPVAVQLNGVETEVPLGWLVENKHRLPVQSSVKDKKCWATISNFFHFNAVATRLVEIELANGRKLVLTDNHVVYLADGSTKMAGQLTLDDELMETTE